MARGKHSGESAYFGEESYSRRKSHIEKENDYEEDSEIDVDYENNIDYENNVEDDEDERINYKKLFIVITILIFIVLIIFGVIRLPGSKNNSGENSISSSKMLSQVDGYNVLGKLRIDKINLDQYILDSKEDNALQKGICKLYGKNLNSNGNLCLMGHNNENMFAKLDELEIGDTFVLIDKNEKETKYEVKDIYQVEPDNLECLLQNESKVEVTLITCESGSAKRLVVKAEKVK